jgi:membrane protein implicated in regulation of membrane protease activity
MKSKSVLETGIISVAAMIVAVSMVGNRDSKQLVWVAFAGVVALSVFLGYRYLTNRSQQRLELTGSEQYRRLADEYRRLSDLAITAQEHTDLKLGDVSVQLDYLRSQVDSLQKILSEVE